MSASPVTDAPPAIDAGTLETVLQEAVEAVLETCSLQLDRHYVPLPDFAAAGAGDEGVWYGSSIDLSAGGGRWELSLLGERAAVEELARTMFALEPNEAVGEADLADALNEVVNVAAGVLKSYRLDAGQRLAIGLPSFHAEPAHLLAHGHHQQFLDRHGHRLRVLVRWREGDPT